MVKNPNCKSCDSACCKIFFLPEKKRNFLKGCKTFGKIWWKNLYGIIFQFIFVKRIRDPEILKIARTNFGYGYNNKPMTCRLVTDHGCRWYKFRPIFCAEYDCGLRPQVLHELKRRSGLSLPKHIQDGYDKVKNKGD